jgi:hypothetical protein
MPSTRSPRPAPLAGGLPRFPRAGRPHGARPATLRAIRVLLQALLLLALLYTATLCRALLIPLVLAAFIGLALNPIVAFAARHGLPRWLGASVLMLALVGGLGAGLGPARAAGRGLDPPGAAHHPRLRAQAGAPHAPAGCRQPRHPDPGERPPCACAGRSRWTWR